MIQICLRMDIIKPILLCLGLAGCLALEYDVRLTLNINTNANTIANTNTNANTITKKNYTG